MDDRSNQALAALQRLLRVSELNSRELARESDLTASQLLKLRYLGENGAEEIEAAPVLDVGDLDRIVDKKRTNPGVDHQ